MFISNPTYTVFCSTCSLHVRRPGMYMYLCIPAVAKVQWHPISLAGSPSADSLAVLVSNSGELLAPCRRLDHAVHCLPVHMYIVTSRAPFRCPSN
jgi:FAD-binding domain